MELENVKWQNTNVALKEIENILKCSVCRQQVVNPCTLGGCEHFFCRQCVEGDVGNSCPECGVPSHVKDVQTNRQLATAVSLCNKLHRLLNTDAPSSQSSQISGQRSHNHEAPEPAGYAEAISVYDFLGTPTPEDPVAGRTRGAEPSNANVTTKRVGKRQNVPKKRTNVRMSRVRDGEEDENETNDSNLSRGELPSTDRRRKSDRKDNAKENKKTSNKKTCGLRKAVGKQRQHPNTSIMPDTEDRSERKSSRLAHGPIKSQVGPQSKVLVASSSGDEGTSQEEDRSIVSADSCDASVDKGKVPKNTRNSQLWVSPLVTSGNRRRVNLQGTPKSQHSTAKARTPQSKGRKSSLKGTPKNNREALTPKASTSRESLSAHVLRNGSCQNGSVLMSPSSCGSPKTVKKNAKGETPLHIAAIKGDIELVKSLLTEGAIPNIKDHAGWTPLHEACNHGFVKIAETLLENGAMINVPGMDNDTPLHDAVQNMRVNVVQMLVARGANLDARNIHGYKPKDLARTDAIKDALNAPISNTQASQTVTELSGSLATQQIVLLPTGLDREHKIKLQKMATLLHAKILEEYSNKVTHVVTGVNAEGQCPRTLKYLQAVLSGKWILNFEWVELCMEYKERVCEEAFEVPGASSTPDSLAPRRARISAAQQLPGLFDGCHMYFQGQFEYPTPSREELTQLVKMAGACILSREPKPTSLDETALTVPYHARSDSQLANCSHYIVCDEREMSNHMVNSRMCVVSVSWLMDSIATFKLLDITTK